MFIVTIALHSDSLEVSAYVPLSYVLSKREDMIFELENRLGWSLLDQKWTCYDKYFHHFTNNKVTSKQFYAYKSTKTTYFGCLTNCIGEHGWHCNCKWCRYVPYNLKQMKTNLKDNWTWLFKQNQKFIFICKLSV